MTHERTGSEDHPMWEGAVVGVLGAVELGFLDVRSACMRMINVCTELMQLGMLDNLGDVQKYLRKRQAIAQLFAMEFNPEDMPGVECVDIVTEEPRGHFLFSASQDQALQHLGQSYEVNETILRRDTGMLRVLPGFRITNN